MEKSKKILVNIFQETTKIFWILFKVILPVVIIIRVLELIGAIPFLAKFLEPLTSFIGIDGSLGLVWMAAILVNIYAGLAAFASLQAIFDYTIAETKILGLKAVALATFAFCLIPLEYVRIFLCIESFIPSSINDSSAI